MYFYGIILLNTQVSSPFILFLSESILSVKLFKNFVIVRLIIWIFLTLIVYLLYDFQLCNEWFRFINPFFLSRLEKKEYLENLFKQPPLITTGMLLKWRSEAVKKSESEMDDGWLMPGAEQKQRKSWSSPFPRSSYKPLPEISFTVPWNFYLQDSLCQFCSKAGALTDIGCKKRVISFDSVCKKVKKPIDCLRLADLVAEHLWFFTDRKRASNEA